MGLGLFFYILLGFRYNLSHKAQQAQDSQAKLAPFPCLVLAENNSEF